MGSLSVASTFWINVTNDTNSTRVLFEISFQLNPLQGQFIVWKQQKHKYLIKQVRILSLKVPGANKKSIGSVLKLFIGFYSHFLTSNGKN